MKFTSGTMLVAAFFCFMALQGVGKYVDSIPYSPPHIKSPPYLWNGGCQKKLYDKNQISCDCENNKYKESPFYMMKYGINEQRMDGMYRIGNDLVIMTSDFSRICFAKNKYSNIYHQ